LKVATINVPKIRDDEVLVRVRYAGVNPVDTYIREGAFPDMPSLPYTPGADGAGEIASIGARVKSVKVGDTVFFCSLFAGNTQGSYGEYSVVLECDVWSLPSDSRLDLAAGLGVPYITAHRSLFLKGHSKSGDTILVHGGSGAVGRAAVQMAVHHGLKVLATAGSDQGLADLKELGAECYDHRDKAYPAEILKRYPKKLDVILEMRADVNLDMDSQLIGQNGRIVVIGCRGPTQIDGRNLMFPEACIIGIVLASSTKDEWQLSARYVKDGFIAGYHTPNVSQIYSLEEAAQAHRDVITNPGGAQGKRVIKID